MINHSPVLHVISYNLPRFISFLYLSQLKVLQLLPQNKQKCNRNSGNIIETVIPIRPSYVTGSKNFRCINCYIRPLRLRSVHSFWWKPFLLVEAIGFINFMVFKDQLIAISERLYTPCVVKYIKVTIFQKSDYNIIPQRIYS